MEFENDRKDFVIEIMCDQTYKPNKNEILHAIFNDIFKGDFKSISSIEFQSDYDYRKVYVYTDKTFQDVIGKLTLNDLYFKRFYMLPIKNNIIYDATLKLVR